MNLPLCSVFLIDPHISPTDKYLSELRSIFGQVTVATDRDLFDLLTQYPTLHLPILVLVFTEKPQDSGFQLLRTISTNHSANGIIPIACSTCDSPPFIFECINQGARDFIIKPFGKDATKTLFLNIHRYKTLEKSYSQNGTTPTTPTTPTNIQHHTPPFPNFPTTINTNTNSNNIIPTTTTSSNNNHPNDNNKSGSFSPNHLHSQLSHLAQHSHSNRKHQSWHHSSRLSQLNGKVWKAFEKRLKDVFLRDTWLASTVTGYFLPHFNRMSPVTSLLPERKQQLKEYVCDWGFITLDLSERELVECVFIIISQVMDHPDLISIRIDSDALYNFLFDVCNSYHRENNYHNFRHAVDVLQATYYFLSRIGCIQLPNTPVETHKKRPKIANLARDLLRPIDTFALLMAAVGHDIGHPGVNNMFMINSSTPLAILYNDRSVLESFHSMAFCHLLQQHGFRQLVDVRNYPESAVPFRKVVVSSILATDMGRHEEYVKSVEEQAVRLKKNAINFQDERQCEQERLIICGALIKCADISNCARPFSSAEKWAKLLVEEFCKQGDLEKELGMPVLPMNQRGKLPLEDFQLSFKRNVAYKLFTAVKDVLPEMEFTVKGIDKNIELWEEMKRRGHHDSGRP